MMYVDNILLYKPISSHEDYNGLQTDIDAIQDCISISHLTLNHRNTSISFAQGRDPPPAFVGEKEGGHYGMLYIGQKTQVRHQDHLP